MDVLLFFINQIVFIALESATLLFLYLYMVGMPDFIRKHWHQSLIYIILYLVLSYFLVAYRGLPLTLVYIVFNILIISYITKTSLYLSITANILVFLIYGISETLVSIPVLYFMGVSFSEAMADDLLQMKALLIIRPIQTAALILLARPQLRPALFEKHYFRTKNSSVTLLPLVIFLISVLYSNLVKYIYDTAVLIISGLMFLSVVLLGVLDTKERIKWMDIQNQLKLQQEYSKHMELIVDAVRKEKHDYKNHISTLVALCTMRDLEAIDEFRTYALKLTGNELTVGLHFYNTGNKYLDGLLAVKNSLAAKNDIYFEVDVERTLEDISVDDVDLTTIIGNIVDNAFDAVMMNPPDKKKIVSLSVFEEDDQCCISISNNGSKIPEVHQKHIFEYKYSTKDKLEGERGYGLYIVNELTQRNQGVISFRSDEYETEFLLCFNFKTNEDKRSTEKTNLTYGPNQSL
ncbi:MAG TPA: GHKL domain-containing protein [Clostridiales bacterium]|nr:GHKL domain-containing protein [Clostridiales bacterium]